MDCFSLLFGFFPHFSASSIFYHSKATFLLLFFPLFFIRDLHAPQKKQSERWGEDTFARHPSFNKQTITTPKRRPHPSSFRAPPPIPGGAEFGVGWYSSSFHDDSRAVKGSAGEFQRAGTCWVLEFPLNLGRKTTVSTDHHLSRIQTGSQPHGGPGAALGSSSFPGMHKWDSAGLGAGASYANRGDFPHHWQGQGKKSSC